MYHRAVFIQAALGIKRALALIALEHCWRLYLGNRRGRWLRRGRGFASNGKLAALCRRLGRADNAMEKAAMFTEVSRRLKQNLFMSEAIALRALKRDARRFVLCVHLSETIAHGVAH